MPLAPGTRLGPYEILAPLGAGGMGEVYRAKDTRLDRTVAVKVLPAHLAADPGRRQRLEREARAVSSLSHPNICTLFDIGHQEGIDFLVMELLSGESLAERLKRGPLPLPEMLKASIEIAGALDRAHRSGIVHRDLKPGNIMLTRAGTKLLDFGLAKGMDLAGAPSNLTAAPTATSPLTADGTIVGTFQYMSPEQLDGREADSRSDLFAFGAVMYEMATGARAFGGKTQASLIASILKDEPRSITSMAPMTPTALDRLVRLCLRKDPDERIQSAHDLRLQLEAIAEGGAVDAVAGGAGVVVGTAAVSRTRERLAWAIAALLGLAAIALASRAFLAPAAVSPDVIVSSILAPDATSFDAANLSMALSPDGRHVALVARNEEGSGLWIRSLDGSKPRMLAGTEDAECPFWSPDSRSIGFRSQGRLRKVDLDGGQSEILAEMSNCLGASWAHDGSILYVADRYAPVMRIPKQGQAPVVVTPIGPEGSKRLYSQPSLLPDGRHVLYTVNQSWEGGENNGIFVATLDGKEERRLIPVLSNAAFVQPGYLVYGNNGSLRAQRFDPESLELSGESIPLIEGVQYIGITQSHLFSFSAAGMMTYIAGSGVLTRELTWVDRTGGIVEKVGKPGNYFSPRLSHDGTRIAYDQSESTSDSGDIWVLDRERGIGTRLTYDPRNESAPVWSPDDRRLAFFGNLRGGSDLFTVAADGTGTVETLLSDAGDNLPTDWSRDGKFVLVQRGEGTGLTKGDLHILSVEEKKSTPWLATPFVEKGARFSPDQRFIAYDSDESGKWEVYVRGFMPPGGKWRVSSDGGTSPIWRPDGRELLFLSPDLKVMSVAVGTGGAFEGGAGGAFEGGAAVALFKVPGSLLNLGTVTQYDVTADGRRFLMNLDTPTVAQRAITLVTNWTALLKRR